MCYDGSYSNSTKTKFINVSFVKEISGNGHLKSSLDEWPTYACLKGFVKLDHYIYTYIYILYSLTTRYIKLIISITQKPIMSTKNSTYY